MTASVTIGKANVETRPARITRTSRDGNVRTVQVRPGRGTARRDAINASLGYGR